MTPSTRVESSAEGASADGSVAISVKDVVRHYRMPRRSMFTAPGHVVGLDGVSFEVLAGERFGIVGESGSGKSTLLRVLAGLDKCTSGQVVIDGLDISAHNDKALRPLRAKLQMVFQDPMGSLDPRMRVRNIVTEPLVAQRKKPAPGYVAELLESVGISADGASRYPHQFSGGQRQRISIARALAPSPSILVADEPVSALDVSVRAQVLNLITDLVDRLDLTLVFVSHDLSVVHHLCDRVAVMKDGKIVELGPTDEVYANPQHPYTKQLVAAIPTVARSLAGARTRDLLLEQPVTDTDGGAPA